MRPCGGSGAGAREPPRAGPKGVNRLLKRRISCIDGLGARALEAPIMQAVEVLEDAVLVVEHNKNFPNITDWLVSKRARRRSRTPQG